MNKENELYAKAFINAIKELASDTKKLDNLESYLSKHFDIWMERYANTPCDITYELRGFAEIEI